MFDGTDPDKVYYSAFVDTFNADNKVLHYGEDIQDQKEVEVNKAYIEALDNYIRAKWVVPGKDSIKVLSWVKHRKWDASGNPIGKEHSNPILNTRVYELEHPYIRVDEYALNIII